jgi:hypothetical protein
VLTIETIADEALNGIAAQCRVGRMVWRTMRFIAAIKRAPTGGRANPVRGTWSSVKKLMPQALHSNTLTSHSPSCFMLRGVSIIDRPQFAQVGDWGMVLSEPRARHGCSELSCAPSLCS